MSRATCFSIAEGEGVLVYIKENVRQLKEIGDEPLPEFVSKSTLAIAQLTKVCAKMLIEVVDLRSEFMRSNRT